MWPWAHAAVGYLLYALVLRVTDRRRPEGVAVLALALGTQLPDLLDKTLAWYLHVLPYGRSLAHSLLTGTLVAGAVVVVLARRDRRVAGAFALGYYSHLLADAAASVVDGGPASAGFLAWPLVPPPATEVEGLLAHLRNVEGSPLFLFGLVLTAAALGLWARHGYPGLAELRNGLVAVAESTRP